MNKPKSFEDACLIMGTTPEAVISEEARKYLTPREILSREIDWITCCINGPNFKADHKNHSQRKYWPWFRIVIDDSSPFGFRLTGGDFAYGLSDSFLGARLPFATEDGAVFMGQTFADKYAEMLFAEHSIKWVFDQVKG